MAENIRRPRKKSFADEAMVRDLVDGIHRYSEKRYPFLVGTIVWVIDFFTKGLALNIRAITRTGLGSRTFGFFMVIEAFFLQKILLIIAMIKLDGGEVDFREIFFKSEFLGDKSLLDYSLFWWPDFGRIRNMNNDDLWSYIMEATIPMIFGYIFLLACMIKLFGKFQKRFTWQRENSYSSGESIFFEGWKGKKYGKLTVTNEFICMVMEPLIVGIIGIILWKFFNSALGLFFILCSVAVVYEEYKPYWRRREKAQDKIDAEYEADKIKSMLKTYEDGNQGSNGSASRKTVPVAFADSNDLERYRNEMRKMASKEGNPVSLN